MLKSAFTKQEDSIGKQLIEIRYMELSERERGHIEGYANALQDIMFKLIGHNTSSKSYDPCTIDDNVIKSYAFDLKSGGRRHNIDEFTDIDEIRDLMLRETLDYINDVNILRKKS